MAHASINLKLDNLRDLISNKRSFFAEKSVSLRVRNPKPKLHMKKLMLLLAVAFLAACSQPQQNEVKISGVVENPTAEQLEIFYYKDFVLNQTEKVEVALEENNAFSGTLPLAEGQFVYVSMPRRTIMLYLLPGADVSISFNAEDPDQVPVIEGKKALESRFLLSYTMDVDRKYNRSIILNQLGSTSAEAFVEMLDNVYAEKLAYLEGFEDYKKLDKEFVKLLKSNFLYEKYGLLLEYPRAFAYFNPQAGAPVLPTAYYDFLESENLFSDEFVKSRPYFSFANNFLNKYAEENADPDSEASYYEKQYQFAREIFTGKTRDAILSQNMIYLLNFGALETAKDFYADYLTVVETPEFLELVEAEYQSVLALSPGSMAPAITLTDIDGKEVSLSDFAGKVVYLDFWASWCGPCMREVPFAKELKKRMEGQDDLVFLYVSVDTDEIAWRNKVAEMEIQGVHLNVSGFSHEVPANYNLKGVPTFYLIGRDGKIFDNRPPRPSNPKVDEVLLSALEQELV